MCPVSRPVVLFADDEPEVLDAVVPFLVRSGLTVITAPDGLAALREVDAGPPDLCVLDVLMPGADGREVLRQLRRRDDWVPVILLTQVGEAVERAMALEEGADDYLNKPFDPHELVARIRAVLRRAGRSTITLSTARSLVCGNLRVDRTGRRCWVREREVALTPRALSLLDYFLVHPDEVLSREHLLEVLWGFEDMVGTRAVDNRVAELRKVLGDPAPASTWIETISGRGYRWVPAVRPGDLDRGPVR